MRIFDGALHEKLKHEFSVEVPDPDGSWKIGAIVGPSGSGKRTIARHVFGDRLYGGEPWPVNKAVVDGFGERSIREITKTLTAVGFASVLGPAVCCAVQRREIPLRSGGGAALGQGRDCLR